MTMIRIDDGEKVDGRKRSRNGGWRCEISSSRCRLLSL